MAVEVRGLAVPHWPRFSLQVEAINGSGRSPSALTLERARADVGDSASALPIFHAHTVTVPGACAGWCGACPRPHTTTRTHAAAPPPLPPTPQLTHARGMCNNYRHTGVVWQWQSEHGGGADTGH